jgi:hypothetical protein
MATAEMSLLDIPDLTGVGESRDEFEPFANGWYQGVILEERSFTDRNGNDRVFASEDSPSQAGDSRNIRLQLQLKRTSDGRELNVGTLINYRPDDLTQESVQEVIAHQEKVKAGTEEWGPLFRSFATLQRLGKLQKIAKVRSFAKADNGGLELGPLYGKTIYVRLRDDSRNPQYKEVADMSDTPPRKGVI